MVFRLELTYSKNENILDMKNKTAWSAGYTLPPGTYESSDPNLLLKSLLPNDEKVLIAIDDIRLRSNLTFNKAKSSLNKLFSIPH